MFSSSKEICKFRDRWFSKASASYNLPQLPQLMNHRATPNNSGRFDVHMQIYLEIVKYPQIVFVVCIPEASQHL